MNQRGYDNDDIRDERKRINSQTEKENHGIILDDYQTRIASRETWKDVITASTKDSSE